MAAQAGFARSFDGETLPYHGTPGGELGQLRADYLEAGRVRGRAILVS